MRARRNRIEVTRTALFALVALSMLLISTAIPAFGQLATGALTGTLTDAQGAAMAGVNVVIRNADTGVEKSTTSDDVGRYGVSLLQPGTYAVTASQTGFATVVRPSVLVGVGQTIRIDVEMPVAAQQALVTVTTEAPVLETEKTQLSQNVTENMVDNLPTTSRRWEQFVLLTPGVTPDGTSGQMSFHGLNGLYNNNSVDGANNNSSYYGTARGRPGDDGYVYSGAAIREFQVSSGAFTAESGQAAGGLVNAVTKSGTNAFHGELFWNLRNPIFNALDPVAKGNSEAINQEPRKLVRQQNQYGFALGGPIARDRIFFFANYDGYRKINPIAIETRQLNPSITDLACPNPASGLSAAQCAAAKNYATTEVIGTFPRNLRQDVELIKLDYQANQANNFSVVVNNRDWKEPKAGAGSSVPGSQVTFNQNRFVIANWTTIIGVNKVNQLRYQWGKDLTFRPPANVGGAPGVGLSGLFNYGSTNGSTRTNERRHQISDNFSYTKGAHTFKTGFDWNRISYDARSAANSAGRYAFSSAVALPAIVTQDGGCTLDASFGSSAQRANTIFCDWLIDLYGVDVGDGLTGKHWTNYTHAGDSSGGTVEFAPGFAKPQGFVAPDTYIENFYSTEYAWYLQDTWKARANVTVDYGVRYDLQTFPRPHTHNTSTPLLAIYTEKWPSEKKAIQPRIGVAWNFADNTVLRVGGGVYYSKSNASTFKTFSNGGDNPQVNCIPSDCVSPAFTTAHTFPNTVFDLQDVHPGRPFTSSTLSASEQPVAGVGLPFPEGQNVCPCDTRAMDPTQQRPRAWQGQMAIEHELPGSISVSATYHFTRGLHLPYNSDVNVAPSTATKSYDVVNSSGVTQLTSTVPFFTVRPDNTGAIYTNYSGISQRYNGLILTVRKAPTGFGLEVVANYTLSRSKDGGQAGVLTGGEGFYTTHGFLDPFNRGSTTLLPFGEEGYSTNDVRHRFTSSLVWQPNFGNNVSNAFARGILRGWSISNTATISGGTRYSANIASSAIQCLVPTGSCPAGSRGLLGGMTGILISSSGNPIGGRAAWLPRNSFTQPSLINFDVRVAKQFTITEGVAFEFRAEAFNILNTTLVQRVFDSAFTYVKPSATSSTCPSASHVNTCMAERSSFQNARQTSSNLFGARQMQFGLRVSF